MELNHEPGCAHALHKGADVGGDIGEQEVAKRGNAQRTPQAGQFFPVIGGEG